MIKIIKGYYGYKNGNSIIPKSSKDEPFSCDKAEEARLVKLGVAEYVTSVEAKWEGGVAEVEAPSGELYTDNSSLAELKETAKKLGATDEDLKPLKSKAQVKELIDKLADEIAEGEPVEGPDESEIVEAEDEAPDLGNDDGVVE